ncbi:MAG: TIGR02281 family clan AA aspartic protease [Candidatus Onthomorpha sp.]
MNRRVFGSLLSGLVLAALCVACRQEPAPLLNTYEEESLYEVPFERRQGVRFVKVKVNGVEMEMLFDTGASDVSISLTEANYLFKQGKLNPEDIEGYKYSQIADGSIVEGMVINIRRLELGEGLIAENVKAFVVGNMKAPLLLGNSAIEDFGSFEIDDVDEVIRFN